MSVIVETKKFTREELKKIDNDLDLVIKDQSGFCSEPKLLAVYALTEDQKYLHIPFSYAIQTLGLKRPERNVLSKMSDSIKFIATLRPQQEEIKSEVVDILNRKGSAMLSLFTGGGKSILAIKIATMIRLKTLIINNRIQILKQWKESIEKFCLGAKIQLLDSKSSLDLSCDFFIMNATNIPKMGFDFFKNVQVVIVDESHSIMAETLSKSLQYVYPRYLLGLTATPYRPDGLNILMDIYFGPEKVHRKMYREHVVYKVETKFKPVLETTSSGKLNWGVVLNSLAENEERNSFICDLICKEKDRSILVMCKRVKQAKMIVKILISRGESVTTLIGSEQSFDKEARILVGMEQKCGTGFDHDRLDCLFLASDVDNGEKTEKNDNKNHKKNKDLEHNPVKEKFFIQILGRVFRREDTVPVIYDFVDKFGVLEKHFKSREQIYKEVGGTITLWKPKLL